MTRDSSSFSQPRSGGGCRSRTVALAVAVGALLSHGHAAAFSQQTTVEGPVGANIGGVWLSVQQVAPEFRIQYRRPTDGPALPFKVGPIPADLAPLTGKHLEGVSVTELTDAGKCADLSIFLGDIVTKINAVRVPDEAAVEKVLKDAPPTVALTIRRPALKMTWARLLKIRYVASGDSADGMSTMGGEKADVQILDVQLPFADKLEATRRSHELWQPSASDIKALADSWASLPQSQPATFIQGKNRLVAASDYDDALAADENLKDSKHALVAELDGNPTRGGGGGGKVVDVYGMESVTPQRIEGSYVSVAIANAPFPINIEFKGRFVMTRLADWSDKDDQLRREEEAKKHPKEDLDSFKLAPEIPDSAKKK